jgi:hypothetical protein
MKRNDNTKIITDDLFLEAIASNDIELMRDYIAKGADVTVQGNYAMNHAIFERNTKMTTTLLEERFNILKNSNPILTLLGCLLTNNKQLLENFSQELSNPKVILYALYHCTPKTATEKINSELVKRLTEHTSLEALKGAEKESKNVTRGSTTARPRHKKTLEVIKQCIQNKKKEILIKGISTKNTNDSILTIP